MTRLPRNALAPALVLALTLPLLTLAADEPALPNRLKPTANVSHWRFELHGDAKGEVSATKEELVFDVTGVDDTPWHVQCFQTQLDLQNDAGHTLTFQAKADAPRDVTVQAQMDEAPWEMIGLNETIKLTTEWKQHEFKFTVAHAKPNRSRVGFVLGASTGRVRVKDVVLTAEPKPEGL